MRKIQMVDLRRQHKHIRRTIRKRIKRVIKSTSFIQGEEVRLFEKNLEDFLEVKHVVSCASGTDALQIAMMALELQAGDEIIQPAFTYISAAEAAVLLGLKPVLVDIDPETFNMLPSAVEAAITERTRAIVATHLFGQCCDMASIMEIAERHSLFVIEDACQAMGAEYILREGVGELQMGPFTYNYRCSDQGVRKKAGTIGHIGCFSFFPSKNLGCYGDGGAICSNLDDLALRARQIANHGAVRKYVHAAIGINSRLDSIQAAVLNAKLPLINWYNFQRQLAAGFYDRAFVSCMQLKVPGRNPHSTHVFHQYCLLCRSERERNALRFHLESLGIPTMVYYPLPIHLQEAYAFAGNGEGSFPVAEDTCRRIMAIPIHTELSQKQLRYITRSILDFFN